MLLTDKFGVTERYCFVFKGSIFRVGFLRAAGLDVFAVFAAFFIADLADLAVALDLAAARADFLFVFFTDLAI